MKTLEQVLAEIPPESRARIEARARELRAEEDARQVRRAAGRSRKEPRQ